MSAHELLELRNAAGEPLVARALDDHGVLTLRLNRPERANAWIEAMEAQYFAALDAAAEDARVRAIVLTGTGRAFCPGMDMERLREVTEDGRPYALDRRPQTILRTLPKPVVAAVNGACAGIGFVQALMADVRFTAREAKWTASFSRIGLVAEDAVAWRLQRLAGEETAADVLLSARVMTGDEVAGLRIASRAVAAEDLMDAAVAYARDLATRSPRSMALIKRQLALDAEATMEEARRRAVAYLADAKAFPDYAEGVAAHRERRAPRFAGLDAMSYPDASGPRDRPLLPRAEAAVTDHHI